MQVAILGVKAVHIDPIKPVQAQEEQQLLSMVLLSVVINIQLPQEFRRRPMTQRLVMVHTQLGALLVLKWVIILGMAPESDLVLCGAGEGNGLTDDAILNSAKYIANYAKSVGKPCVISISLGSETGPHDGKSYISLGYDQIAEQYGAIICLLLVMRPIALVMQLRHCHSSDAMAVIHTPISSMSSYGLYIYGICDVWNSTSDQLKVQVKVLNSSGTAVYTSDAMSNGTNSASTLSNYFTSVSNGGIEIAGSVIDANNGRYNLNIVPYLGTNKGSYKLAYVITGSAGNVINVFTENNYSQLASSGSISGYTLSKGQNDGTM